MKDLHYQIKSLSDNKIVRGISIALVIIGLIVLVITGFGFLSTLFLFLLIALVIFFGSIRELAGSTVVAGLFKILFTELKSLLSIFFIENHKVLVLVDFFNQYSWFKLTLIIFFFIFLISFLTGSIKLFNVKNKNEAKTDKSEKKELN